MAGTQVTRARSRLNKASKTFKEYESEFEKLNSNHINKLSFIYAQPPDFTSIALPDWMDSLSHRPLSAQPGAEKLLDPYNITSDGLRNYLEQMHGGNISP